MSQKIGQDDVENYLWELAIIKSDVAMYTKHCEPSSMQKYRTMHHTCVHARTHTDTVYSRAIVWCSNGQYNGNTVKPRYIFSYRNITIPFYALKWLKMTYVL